MTGLAGVDGRAFDTALRGVIGCKALMWCPGDGGRLDESDRLPRDGGVEGAVVQFLAEIPGRKEMASWSHESQVPGERISEP
jgi:hypothetical protein